MMAHLEHIRIKRSAFPEQKDVYKRQGYNIAVTIKKSSLQKEEP